MTDDEILKAARKIQIRIYREEKLHEVTAERKREVTLTFEAVSPAASTAINARTRPFPAVSFQVPYELACAFARENEEIV
jgi:hypothetical protein